MPCCGEGVEGTVAAQPLQSPAAPESNAAPANAAVKAPPSEKPAAPISTPVAAAPEAAPPALGSESKTPVSPTAAREEPSASVAAPAAAPAATRTSNVHEEPKPAWAAKEKAGTVGTDTSPDPDVVEKASGARPAKKVPEGFVSGTRKDQEISSGVQNRIAGLQASGLKTNNTGGKRMKTPRIITDTKESWDKQGNITREITRYITEPSGEKRTEKETVYIPAGEVEEQPQQ